MGARGRQVGAGALVTLTAVVVATVVGVATALVLRLTVEDSSGWGDLVAVVSGMVIGLGAGAVAWVVALLAAVRRLAPAGHRLGVAAWPTALAAVGVTALLVGYPGAVTAADAAGGVLVGLGAALLLGAAPLGLGLARTPWAAHAGPSTQPSGSASV